MIKIGRAAHNQLPIDDDLLSRTHMVIDNAGPGNVALCHLGEAPLPSVRGLPLSGPARKLVTGDQIDVGNLRIVLESVDGAPSTPAAGETRPAVLDELARRAQAADVAAERRLRVAETAQRGNANRELRRTLAGSPENLVYVLPSLVTLAILALGGVLALQRGFAWGAGILALAAAWLVFLVTRGFDLLLEREVAFFAGMPFRVEGYLEVLSMRGSSSEYASVHVIFSGALPPESAALDLARAQHWESRFGTRKSNMTLERASKDRWVFELDAYAYQAQDNTPLRTLMRRLLREGLAPLHTAYPIAAVQFFRT